MDGEYPPSVRVPGNTATSRPRWLPPIRLTTSCWGRDYVNMPRLKSFTMDIDALEHDRPRMAAFVDWAVRTWPFPLNPSTHEGGHHYLAADGPDAVGKSSWRSPRWFWPQQCPCGYLIFETIPDTEPDHDHDHRPAFRQLQERMGRGFGPRAYTWTIRWTPRRHRGPEVYPYGDWVAVHPLDVGAPRYDPMKSLISDQPPGLIVVNDEEAVYYDRDYWKAWAAEQEAGRLSEESTAVTEPELSDGPAV